MLSKENKCKGTVVLTVLVLFCYCRKASDLNTPPYDRVDSVGITYLSQGRVSMTALSFGDKIYFAGGLDSLGASNIIDIYDADTRTWNTDLLSQPRFGVAGAATGNVMMFGGGLNYTTWYSDIVDVYNKTNDTWMVSHLSVPRAYTAAAATGNFILFAGGRNDSVVFSTVDMYDLSTNTWSTANLSEPRAGLGGAASGNYIVFAGGSTDIDGDTVSTAIDIFNTVTKTWSTSQLIQPLKAVSSAVVGRRIFFTGLSNVIDSKIEVFDVSSQTCTTIDAPAPLTFSAPVAAGNYVLFAGGLVQGEAQSTVFAYNDSTGSWTTKQLPYPDYGMVGASAKNLILFGGGSGIFNGSKQIDIFSLSR